MSYLNLNDYQNSIKYLSKFNSEVGLINHSGKARKPLMNIYNIILDLAQKKDF